MRRRDQSRVHGFSGASPFVVMWSAALWCGQVQAQSCASFWSGVGTPPVTPAYQVASLDEGSGPRLYVGGRAIVPGHPSNLQPVPVISWNGQSWIAEDIGRRGLCNLLVSLSDSAGPFLFAGGYDDTVTPIAFWAMTKRSGTWAPAPAAMSTTTAAPRLGYRDATGDVIIGIVVVSPGRAAVGRWDGSAWQVLGGPATSTDLRGFAAADLGAGTTLYVCGGFSAIGGVAVQGVARWNGGAWEAVGAPPPSFIPVALQSYDDGHGPVLYMGGGGQPPGSPVPTSPFYKWTGSQWVTVGGDLTVLTHSPLGVDVLQVFDDGHGPGLYAAGTFTHAGGSPALHIARWDGASWSALGQGVGVQVRGLTIFDDPRGHSLIAAGTFITAGGGSSPSVARWVGCPNCHADCDESEHLNVNDLVCFTQKFAARDPYANCDQSVALNAGDFVCFMQQFAAGCR